MGQVRDLIGAQGAAAAGVLGPAEHSGFEEGAIDDQLTAALEQIEQAYLALGSVELVLLLHRHPRHPSTLGGQRVTGAGQGLLLHEQLLALRLPLLRRHDRRCGTNGHWFSPSCRYIGGVRPGTDEGAMMIRIPSPTIASASGTSMAAFAGRSFWARTRTAIPDIQVTLMTPSATSISISPMLEPTQ